MLSKAQLLGLVAGLPLSQAETLLGAFIFSRHGDRTAKAWPPTHLTAIGADSNFEVGTYYRNRYIASNASTPLIGMSNDLVVRSQLHITAASDGVLENSANAFSQGLYPPAGDASEQTLRDGTTVRPPLGGYQWIPIDPVESAAGAEAGEHSESSGWLQGTTGCGNAIVSSNQYFDSKEYRGILESSHDFYQDLLPVINTTFDASEADFENAYTIYDYINVGLIHNETIPSADLLTNETFHHLHVLANQHEWGLAYNASAPVRSIAGAVLAAEALEALNQTLETPLSDSTGTRLHVQFGSYGTFAAFFGLSKLYEVSDDFTGVVDYSSTIAIELVTNSTVSTDASDDNSGAVNPDDVSVRFFFTNGTASTDNEPKAYPLFGQDEVLLPYREFVSRMNEFAIGSEDAYCDICGDSVGVCKERAESGSSDDKDGSDSSASTSSSGGGSDISLPVAGVIGALVTLGVIIIVEGAVMALFGLRLVKKSVAAAGKAVNEGGAGVAS